MPELPDVVVYIERLRAKVQGEVIERVRISSPFLLRTVDPPIEEVHGRQVVAVRRMGKRIVFEIAGGLFLVLHLMIAGRLRWREPGVRLQRKLGLAAFDFPAGSLLLTEAGTKKRASLLVVRGEAALRRIDPGGIEVSACGLHEFARALRAENHTLKRCLTDPRLFSGIGNAYSDEILHRARLSPIRLSQRLSDDEIARLHEATWSTLEDWTLRLRREVGEGFPEKVTAFRPEMAVHGKFGEPCPDCGAPVQRIVYADNETNYCARCQTEGRILADRSLSRLLRGDWPRSLEELEDRYQRLDAGAGAET